MVFLDVNSFLSPQGGGARTYHLNKAEWFSHQASHRYLVLGPGPGEGVADLGEGHSMNTGWGVPYGKRRNYRFLVGLDVADRLIERNRVDILEVGDPWLTARWSRRRHDLMRTCVWHSDPHTAYLDPWAAQGRPWRKIVARAVLGQVDQWHRHFDLIWCASEWVANLLRHRGYPNVRRLRFGIDKRRFSPTAATPGVMARFGLDPARPVLLYAGRLDFEKGVQTLYRSIPLLTRLESKPQVLVTGRGEWEERFGHLKLDGYAYGGFLPRDELAAVVASATLMVSTCSVETFGLGVLESICSGLPVVSCQGGGAGEQVRDSGAGTLYPDQDVVGLLEAVESALERRDALSRAALAWREQWPSWDEMFHHQTTTCEEIFHDRHR